MINLTTDVLMNWVLSLVIPLSRVLGLIAMAPMLSHNAIPMMVKVSIGVFISIALQPTLPDLPPIDIFSLMGVLIIAEQMMIGVALGLVMQIVFTAVELAGQASAMTMGLSFATFFDPQAKESTDVLSRFLMVLNMLVFLSIDGHLLLISTLAESFHTFPVSETSGHLDGFAIAAWGKNIFSMGLQLSMPILAALLVTNLALGILTRSAPQLNIFGIGFPVTLSMGFLIVALMLPSMVTPLQHFYYQAFNAEKVVVRLKQ